MASGKNIEAVYGLTPLQEGILYHSLRSADLGVYLSQYSVTLHGPLIPELLHKAWVQVAMRHAPLRTLFAWRRQAERPLQVVREQIELPWHFEDWAPLDSETQNDRWQAFYMEQRMQGFVLDKAPLVRLSLFKLAQDEYRFLFCFHHILFDGWSLRLLLDEVARIYASERNQESLELNEPGRFQDHVGWLESRDWRKAEAYWKQTLEGFHTPTPLDLPGPESRSTESGIGFQAITRELASETAQGLTEFSRAQRLTPGTTILGAWSILLSRYAETNDVVFGTTHAGRPAELPAAQQTVGLFINTVPVRAKLEPRERLSDWLRSLQKEQFAAREYELTPLALVERASGVPAGQRLFETLVVYQGVPDAAQTQQPWRMSAESVHEYGNYPLVLLVRPDKSFMLTAVYDVNRIGAEAVKRVLGHVEQLLKTFIEHPDAALEDIDLLPKNERHRLLQEWSGASVNTVSESNGSAAAFQFHQVHALIDDVGRKHPDVIALRQDDEQLPYAELLGRADRLAATMQKRGLGAGGFGAVFLERSPEAIVAMLAVLKTGAAYVPLDPAYPPVRVQAVLEELAGASRQKDGVSLVITNDELAERLPSQPLPVIVTGEADRVSSQAPSISANTAPEDLAYVIYTSGSSGRPKGVMVSHRNLLDSTGARNAHYPESPERFLLLSSVASDSAIAGIFWTLCTGGTLVLPRTRQEQSISEIADIVRNKDVTHLLCLPSIYTMLLDQAGERDFQSLRCAIVAGEACHSAVVGQHHQTLPDTNLYNEYGPSEATVWSTHAPLGPDLIDKHSIPIGRPIEGWRAYVLGRDGRPRPRGLPGELYIGGRGVARGYLAQLEMTDQRFVPDKFETEDSNRLYRTGDRVRFLENGQLTFLGRIDNQFKVRGLRVEPEEIEMALLQHPAVHEAVAVLVSAQDKASEDSPGELPPSRLVAYVGVKDEPTTAAQLREHLRALLPDHMVPNGFVTLEALPRLAGGKVDLNVLRQQSVWQDSSTEYALPSSEVEEALVDIWQSVLGIERVGIHDNFFEIGGDSLLSIRILARAHRLGYEINPVDFFARPTVAEQAKLANAVQPQAEKPGNAEKASPNKPFALAKLDAASLATIAQQLKVADGSGKG